MLNESFVSKSEKKIYDLLPHEPETMATTLFIFGMAIYYIWRMFAITPQYDELYTYYTFISKGPVYGAIHWPLPNNHVGYSVLSGFLDLLGNSYIGLRGVSYLCAVSNLILVYRICKMFYSHGLPFAAVLLYAGMQVINEYSVQGRGYTLATTCFLLSVYTLTKICKNGSKGRFHYVSLASFMVLGLYTVPSSVYWVVPVGLSGVIYLLINAYKSRGLYIDFKDNIYYKKLSSLVMAGIGAAFVTFILYGVIWLAIGSNLLVKTEGSMFFGWSHVLVLVRAPMSAMRTGINYMLSQPYIQSLAKDVFWSRYFGWIWSLLAYMIPGIENVITIFIFAGIACMMYECIRHFDYSRTVINIIAVVNFAFVFIILILQHKLPYLRVFSYMCFLVTICVCSALERLINVSIRLYNKEKSGNVDEITLSRETERVQRHDAWYSGIGVYIPVLAILIVFLFRFFSPNFSCQLGERENDVFNTLYIADVRKREIPAVLDCEQQYLLKFGWDIDCQKTDVFDADMVILDKDMFTPNYSGEDFWKFYQTYETIDWDYLKTMHVIYENDNFVLYVK